MSYEDQLIREATEGPSFQEVHEDYWPDDEFVGGETPQTETPNVSNETGDQQGETLIGNSMLCKHGTDAEINIPRIWRHPITGETREEIHAKRTKYTPQISANHCPNCGRKLSDCNGNCIFNKAMPQT